MERDEELSQLTQLLSIVTHAINERKRNSSVNINQFCELESKIIEKLNAKL